MWKHERRLNNKGKEMVKKTKFIERNVYRYRTFTVDREFLVSPLGINSEGKMRFYNMLEDPEFLREMNDFSIGFKIEGNKVEFYLV